MSIARFIGASCAGQEGNSKPHQHALPACSCSCNTVQQWDMSRAVPRHVNTVSSFTGDILTATTGNSVLYTAGANGKLR